MDYIIYHGDCPDGWCAAFLLKKAWPNAELIPATHGNPPPNLPSDKNIIVVDFSWKRDAVIKLAVHSKHTVILDHHKTAEKELASLGASSGLKDQLTVQFDMDRSGAAMAWDYLHPGKPRPWYVDYVMDRDLWTWKLPKSRDVSAFLMTIPLNEETWDTLDGISADEAAEEGQAINSYIKHYVEKVVDQRQEGRLVSEFDSWTVGIVNAAYPAISEVCNVLCQKGYDIGLGWFQRGDGQAQFSLRSIGDMDVSKIAKAYGGGGHKNAAGFQMSMPDAIIFLDRLRRSNK